jgi:hypothetical protein
MFISERVTLNRSASEASYMQPFQELATFLSSFSEGMCLDHLPDPSLPRRNAPENKL